jgi:hypothetical protein
LFSLVVLLARFCVLAIVLVSSRFLSPDPARDCLFLAREFPSIESSLSVFVKATRLSAVISRCRPVFVELIRAVPGSQDSLTLILRLKLPIRVPPCTAAEVLTAQLRLLGSIWVAWSSSCFGSF